MPLRLPALRSILIPYTFRTASSSMSQANRFETNKRVEMKRSDGTSTGKHEACLTKRVGLNLSIVLRHLPLKNNQQRPIASATSSNKTDSSFFVTDNLSSSMEMSDQAKTSTSDMQRPVTSATSSDKTDSSLSVTDNQSSSMETSDQAKTSTSDMAVSFSTKPECPSVSSGCSSPVNESTEENESSLGVDCRRMLEENSLPTSFGKRWPSQSKKPESTKHSLKNGGSIINSDQKKKVRAPVEVFDICQSEADYVMIPKSPIVFLDETEEPVAVEKLSDEPQQTILRPGMILLKNYISVSEQVSIVKKCRKLGVRRGGFYRPGYKDGAKLRLHMMCLGLDWDPQTRKYSNRRRIDRSKPPVIPPEFHRLVNRAMNDSYALIRSNSKASDAEECEDILPRMNPDICIVNFYSETGRLGLHQDRDESPESLSKGLPVVSVSLGDSAEFLYGDHRDANKAEKLILESGDVLIFGGKSRHVFHGVASIIPDSAPHFLLDGETKLRPGRLNLTFRQY